MKPGMRCIPITWEFVEAGGLKVEGHPWLHSELEANLGTDPVSKNIEEYTISE